MSKIARLICIFNKPDITAALRQVAPEIASFINTLRPRRNEQHLADDIFKHIFFNENVWISIKISPKFVPKGPIKQYSSIGSGNGLALFRRQAIIWTNDG